MDDEALAALVKQRQAEIYQIAQELKRRGWTVNAQSDDRYSHDRYYPDQEYRVTVSKTEINTTYL